MVDSTKNGLRERISETAFRRFLNQGYESVRIRDIADECGISNSLLQHYYPKRADLMIDPFFNLIFETLQMLSDQIGKDISQNSDADLACVDAFYHVFYSILHANKDRLLKLYTVILYDSVTLKRGTDLVLDNSEGTVWQGNTKKSILGSYAINGIMSQFVVLYFDNRLTSDLMQFVDMALDMNYDLLGLDEARRTYVRTKSQELVDSPATQEFMGAYLSYIDSLMHS